MKSLVQHIHEALKVGSKSKVSPRKELSDKDCSLAMSRLMDGCKVPAFVEYDVRDIWNPLSDFMDVEYTKDIKSYETTLKTVRSAAGHGMIACWANTKSYEACAKEAAPCVLQHEQHGGGYTELYKHGVWEVSEAEFTQFYPGMSTSADCKIIKFHLMVEEEGQEEDWYCYCLSVGV